MLRYFYSWTPLVIVGTVVLLALPWLGGIAVLVVAFAALMPVVALAWGAVWVARMLIRAVSHGRHALSGWTPPRAGAAPRVYRPPHAYTAWQRAEYGTPRLGRSVDAMSSGRRDRATDQTHLP